MIYLARGTAAQLLAVSATSMRSGHRRPEYVDERSVLALLIDAESLIGARTDFIYGGLAVELCDLIREARSPWLLTHLRCTSATDDELFDAGRIVHTCKDTRTVGEMLHDADHLARQLLMDISGEDAGHLLRSWPTLVDAGSRLWDALPGRRRDPAEHDLPMRRLSATTSTFTDFSSGLAAGPEAGHRTPASTRSAKRCAPLAR